MPVPDPGPAAVAATGDGATGAPAWKPWFPVIDYGRCENCRQCMGFCLFGVYGVDPDGTVRVANPAKCKTGCPACARMCPSAAIIFPKYANAPINGGEVEDGAALQDRGKGALPSALEMDQVRAIQERMLRLADPHGGRPLARGHSEPSASTEEPA